MIGTMVGNYRIVEKLGDGGMGAVYRAVDELLDREVALKVLRSELAGKASLIERFRAEAIALARLNHPRIATMYGLERNGVDFVMIMEYVRGKTLEQVVEHSGKLSWVRAVEICIDICDALDHAHDRGVVHRDIKPANVMLSNTGLIKVMDFGIARVVGRDRQTQFGHAVGTPMYMAPEQLRGEEVDGRADLYALGAVLFELITGSMAFEAESDYALMMKQLHEPPPAPSSIVPEVPDAVDRIVISAMAKSRDDRPVSAAVMRASLRDALRAGPRNKVAPRPQAPPPATRIAVESAPPALPVAAAGASPAGSPPETRIASPVPPAHGGVPETRFADAAVGGQDIPATRFAFDASTASAGVASTQGNSWIAREATRWRSDRNRWIGAALLVVAVGASTAKFLGAKPDINNGGQPPVKSGQVTVATDTTHVVKPIGGGIPDPPREEVRLPKVGSLQEVGGGTTPTPPPAATGGRASRPPAAPVDPKTHTPRVDTPSSPGQRTQAPRESVLTPPAVLHASDVNTSTARFHTAGNKQIDAFLQLIKDRDVTNVERLLLASGTNRAVHEQLVALLRAGRVEVSDVNITGLTRTENGGAAQFDATLNFRSPFGANRKSPAQFALDLAGEAEGWVVKAARVVGSPKFK